MRRQQPSAFLPADHYSAFSPNVVFEEATNAEVRRSEVEQFRLDPTRNQFFGGQSHVERM